MHRVSVVIPVYNGLGFLRDNMSAVAKLGAGEVVVVDDASTDGSYEYVWEKHPRVKLVRHLRNQGFPKTVNDGVAAAKGEVVVLLNQDVRPTKNIISVVEPYFGNEMVFAVTFNETSRSWARAQFKNGFVENYNGYGEGMEHESFWASGGSAAFRRVGWDEMGGFDLMFSPGYFEDLDLGWRAHKRGWRILWVKRAVVKHAAESTFRSVFKRRHLQRIKDRNYLLAHWKNLDNRNLREHALAVLDRVLMHPGYLVPVAMALRRLGDVAKFRGEESKHVKFSDSEVFSKFNE